MDQPRLSIEVKIVHTVKAPQTSWRFMNSYETSLVK
jgi:hypothetical protein